MQMIKSFATYVFQKLLLRNKQHTKKGENSPENLSTIEKFIVDLEIEIEEKRKQFTSKRDPAICE